MKNFIKFLLSLSGAILIVVLLNSNINSNKEVFAQQIPIISSKDISVNEGTANATFTLSLSPSSDSTVSASYRTLDGSALSPDDYATTSGTIDFQPGETTKTVDVPIVDDLIIELDEMFRLSVSQFNLERTTNWTATIIDNDSITPTPSPTASPTPAPSDPTSPGDGLSDGKSSCPDCTKPPKYTPPVITPKPPVINLSFLPVEDTVTLTPTPPISPLPILTKTLGVKDEPKPKSPARSILVRSIMSPNEIPVSVKLILVSLISTALLVLLLVFPSELFNSTVQSNYDEIMGWSLIHKVKSFYEKVNHLPALLVVILFAIAGAIINSFLSPDFGFNKPTISLVLGMLLSLVIISTVYDVARAFYMRKRFGHQSKLRAHSIGLFSGALLVTVSRFANFLPGYCFGIFTALVFKDEPDERKNGEGLAFASVALIIVAVIGWFAWVPIKQSATSTDPSFWALVIDAAFATLWVSTLTSTVFGLLPMRFMYGEAIKNWNSKIWGLIYFTGVFLFVYTLLNPAIGVYGKSDKVSWIAVLALFFAFGIFSFLFWGYFRYRHLWRVSR